MTTVIYADVYFFVNLSMDFTALFVCAKIMRLRLSLVRYVIAAGIGGLYAIIALFVEKYAVLSLLLTILIPFLMCAAAYGVSRPGRLILSTALFWGVSFLMGGIISSVYMLLNKFLIGRGITVGGRPDMLYSELPLWTLGLLAALSAVLSSFFGRITKKECKRREASVEVVCAGKKVSFTALYDSGNMLREPISSLPVVIVGRRVAEELFGKEGAERLMKADALFFSGSRALRRMRMIPISTVSEYSVMIGILPDRISVSGVEVNAYMAFDRTGGDFDRCDGLLPREF